MQEFFERMKEGAGLRSDPDSGRLGRRPGEEVPTAAPGWVGFSQARGASSSDVPLTAQRCYHPWAGATLGERGLGSSREI